MDLEQFKSLLAKNENSILDFKKENYSLSSKNEEADAKFIKDIISFANTIRDESAHIVIGVKEIGHKKEFYGLDNHIDDAILQSKVKDKVHPIPKFSFSTVEHDGFIFGVIQIPVVKYDLPITPTVKMKGLIPGTIYFRRGSSNDVATTLEAIQIHDWIRNLTANGQSVEKEISEIVSKLNDRTNYLSTHLPQALVLARKIGDNELEKKIKYELGSWTKDDRDPDLMSYRSIRIFVSHLSVKSVMNRGGNIIADVWREFKGRDDFHERDIIFADSISEIEDMLDGYNRSGTNQLHFRTVKGSQILSDASEYGDRDFYIYYNFFIINDLYSKIRQEIASSFIKHI